MTKERDIVNSSLHALLLSSVMEPAESHAPVKGRDAWQFSRNSTRCLYMHAQSRLRRIVHTAKDAVHRELEGLFDLVLASLRQGRNHDVLCWQAYASIGRSACGNHSTDQNTFAEIIPASKASLTASLARSHALALRQFWTSKTCVELRDPFGRRMQGTSSVFLVPILCGGVSASRLPVLKPKSAPG